jgi:NADH-quinone oxidoreductase subunit C
MNKTLKSRLTSAFDGIKVKLPEADRMVITAKKEAVLSILSFLKNSGYDHLGLISCVDRIDKKTFELIYILSAYMERDKTPTGKELLNIILKTTLPREAPSFLSVMPVFSNAEPYEREIHELFGVHFEGHPRLIPLFLERPYKTPPFRKDFDTRRYVKKTFDSIPPVEKKAVKP